MQPATKLARHQHILRIIEEREVSTQEQLAAELKRAGFHVTQATVSRDIRELGLVKVASDARYRYAAPSGTMPQSALGRAQRAFQDYVVDVAFSGNLLVVKTAPGSASVVAGALDALQLDQIVGTVAGDDALLVVVRDGRDEPPEGSPAELYQLFQAWRSRD